jgi:CHAT domain-containing protein
MRALLVLALTANLLWANDLTPAERMALTETATKHNAAGIALYQQKQLAGAVRQFEQALKIRRQLYPDATAELVQSLTNLAVAYDDDGQRLRAAPLFEEAIEACATVYPEKKYPHGHEHLHANLLKLGSLYRALGESAKALPYLERLVALKQRAFPAAQFPNGHPEVAAGFDLLSVTHYEAGDFAQAQVWGENALAARQKLYPPDQYPHGHLELASSYNNVAAILQSQAQHAAAVASFEKSLAIYRKLRPTEHPDTARALNNLAKVHTEMGQLTPALAYCEQANALYQKIYPLAQYPHGHPDVVGGLKNLGLIYRVQGQFARSLALYEQAHALNCKLYPALQYPNGHPILAQSYNDLGLGYHEQGQFSTAEQHYEKALHICEQLYGQQPQALTAVTLMNLANTRLIQGQLERAAPLYERALALYEQRYPERHYPAGTIELARCMANTTVLYYAQKDYAKARTLAQRALTMRQKLYPPEQYPAGHSELAILLNSLAMLHMSEGQTDQALPLFQRATVMMNQLYPAERYPLGHPQTCVSLYNEAYLHYVSGTPQQALPLVERAVQQQHGLTLANLQWASEAEALNTLAATHNFADLLLAVTRRVPGAEVYRRVAPTKGLLTRVLARRHRELLALAAGDATTRQQLAELDDVRRQLSQRLFALTGSAPGSAEVQQLTQTKERLERALARGVPTPTAEPTPTEVVAQLQARLPADAALVDFVRYVDLEQNPQQPGAAGEKRTVGYVAFVLRAGQAPQRIELGPAAAIEQAWAEWYAALNAQRPDALPAQAMSRLLRTPLQMALRGAKTVYVCPTHTLAQIPFAALPGSTANSVWLEEVALVQVPYPEFLLHGLARTPTKPTGSAVIVGGVDYSAPVPESIGADLIRGPAVGSKRGTWGALPGTLREAEQIATLAQAHLGTAPVLRTGPAAHAGQVRADLPTARYVHLATHGFFAAAHPPGLSALDTGARLMRGTGERASAAARNPLTLSGLVFAGANTAAAGGVVSAEGIIGLDLRQLDLAVLSACETGLGEVAGGEGVLGLQRAFHVAGARQVVASLWKVDDDATAALMQAFYRAHWHEGRPSAEALRAAMLWVYRHPDQIGTLARRRGLDLTESALPTTTAPTQRAATRWWAAFVLSGA